MTEHESNSEHGRLNPEAVRMATTALRQALGEAVEAARRNGVSDEAIAAYLAERTAALRDSLASGSDEADGTWDPDFRD